MTLIELTPTDLLLAATGVLALAGLSRWKRLDIEKPLLIAALRTTVQLLLVGLVLKALFSSSHWAYILTVSLVMLTVAGREVVARQRRPLKGIWSYGVGVGSMFLSSFVVAVLTLVVVIQADPWYTPQYAIPLLGMLLGNTMNGVALGTGHLTTEVWRQRAVIEQRLLLGHTREEALLEIRRESLRTGMVPIINGMAAAGLVSLPGMMTGQILAGSPPVEAVKYQILIMFLIATGAGLGVILALHLTGRRLFDHRHRLQLDVLRAPGN